MKTKSRQNPSYWWDFETDDAIIVESDSPKFPVVGRFPFDPNGGEEASGIVREFLVSQGMDTKIGTAQKAIEEAEILIRELESGRATPIAV